VLHYLSTGTASSLHILSDIVPEMFIFCSSNTDTQFRPLNFLCKLSFDAAREIWSWAYASVSQ
jgi:hypothetical protein